MYIYRCNTRFLAGPLGRYIPVGALIARYENSTRLVIDEAPQSDLDPLNVLVDGVVYTDPAFVTWFYGMEPAPLGTSTSGVFTVVATKTEDAYGNVSATDSGLPTNSELQIDSNGKVYLKSVTNGLFYQLRVTGTDGSAELQIGQTGISL